MKPYDSSFAIKRTSGIQSKALHKFANNAPKTTP